MKLGPQALGTSRYYDVQLTAGDGSSLAAVFTGSETLSAEIWAGDDQPVAATLTAAWAPTSKYASNPAIAQPWVRITVTGTAIANLLPGLHPIRCLINPSTDKIAVLPTDTVLEITGQPGAAVALRQYISAQYMMDQCPWLSSVQSLKNEQAGFAEKRYQAGQWFEKLLHKAAPLGVIGDQLAGSWQPAYRGRNQWLQEQLDAGKLIVTEEIKQAIAYQAIGLILSPLAGSHDKTSLQDLGAWFLAESEEQAKQIVAELDTNAVEATTSGTPTTTSIVCTGDDLSDEDDTYNGWYLKLTSGAQAGEFREITDYTGSTNTFTVTAFNVAPAASVTALIFDGQGEYALDLGQVQVIWG